MPDRAHLVHQHLAFVRVSRFAVCLRDTQLVE
jgi:hypothetical protein